jgi:outer membrane lipoprotein-sorting protein
MMILRMLIAPAIALGLAFPAIAAELSLSEISRYLNSLTTAEATFTQTNADGSTARGTLYIKRPGRARFEYAPPEKSLVIAGAGQVAIFDAKSNQPPEQYPLKRTPLNLILAPNVNLATAKMVVGHRQEGDRTIVVAQDPEKPEYGTIEMVFSSNPTTLRAWVVTDDQGNRTRVDLDQLETGGRFSAFLFDITAERTKREK